MIGDCCYDLLLPNAVLPSRAVARRMTAGKAGRLTTVVLTNCDWCGDRPVPRPYYWEAITYERGDNDQQTMPPLELGGNDCLRA